MITIGGRNLKKPYKEKKFEILRYSPLLIMMGLFLFFTINYGSISMQDIINFTPSNYFLAAGIMVVIYGVKSVSMFVSLSILYVSAGIIFPEFWAIIINFIGLIVCMTIPYFIGRFSGRSLFDKLISKYPKVKKIDEIQSENEWFFVFIIKIMGFIPNEVSSLAFGTIKINYGVYIIASVLAKTPSMIATTLLGSNISKPGSPGFIRSIIIFIIVFVSIGIFYRKNRYRINN